MDHLPRDELEALGRAAALLFGLPPRRAVRRLLDVGHEDLRAALRRAAKTTHPDRAAALGQSREHLSRRFSRVRRAYDRLELLLDDPSRLEALRRALAGADGAPRSGSRPVGRALGEWGAEAGADEAPAVFRGDGAAGPPVRHRATPGSRSGGRRTWRSRPKIVSLLVRLGLVTKQDARRALQWQRERRPRLGELAMAWGRLDGSQVEHIERARRPNERFGQCALRLGLLSPFWVSRLLRRQRTLGKPIGAYFVERGLLSLEELRLALEWQRRLVRGAG